MKSRPNLLTLAMLVLAIGFERFAYYGARSIVILQLVVHEQMDAASASRFYSHITTFSLFTPLLGGLLALGVGPRFTALTGASIAFVGYGLLAVGAPPTLCMVVIALGAGVFRPCPWAIAAEEVAQEASPAGQGPAPMSARRFAAMSAVACVLYGTVNIGAALSFVMGWLRSRNGATTAFGFTAFLMLGCVGVTSVVVFLGRSDKAKTASAPVDPYRAIGAAALRAPRPAAGLAFAGLALLLVIELPYSVASSLSFYPVEMARSGGLTTETMGLLMAVNPFVVVVASVFALALLLVATLHRWSTPPLVLYGLGIVVGERAARSARRRRLDPPRERGRAHHAGHGWGASVSAAPHRAGRHPRRRRWRDARGGAHGSPHAVRSARGVTGARRARVDAAGEVR